MKLKRILRAIGNACGAIVGAGVCLLAVLSCSTDSLPPVQGEDVYINLRIDVPRSSGVPSRALTLDDESAIDNLQVLVFNAVNRFQYKAEVGTLDETKGIVSVRLRRSSLGESYYLVMLANAAEVEPIVNSVEKDVLEKYTFTTVSEDGTPGFPNSAGTRLPMWGKSSPQVIDNETDFGAISFYRAVARIDVGMNLIKETNGSYSEELNNRGEVDNFQLKSIRVYKSLDKGYIAPLDGYGKLSIPDDADIYPTGGATSVSGYVDYSVSDNATSFRDIYLAEANNHTPDAGNKKPEDRCCLVVGGIFAADGEVDAENKVTYYRIDFLADGTTDATLTDILRNHRYVFNIKSVYGPGYGTPEEAFTNKSVNISVNIEHWDNGLNHIDYDGQYNFQYAARTVTLAYFPGSEVNVAIQTNVAVSEWVFENESEWSDLFTVTPVVTTFGNITRGYLTFTAKGFGPNTVRPMKLKVKNLTITFDVSQHNGTFLTPEGVLIEGWGKPNGDNETNGPVTPGEGGIVGPGGRPIVGDYEEGEDIDGGEIRPIN